MTRIISAIGAVGLAMLAVAVAPRQAQANGDAPWCAVLNMGTGDVYWDCHYASAEACGPNVLAGNRGFCNPNPAYVGTVAPRKRYARRHSSQRHD